MSYTISQLQSMLEDRQNRLKTLAIQREDLLTQLKSIDSEIEELSGESVSESLEHITIPKTKPANGKRKRVKKSTRKTSLDYARDILKKNPDGLELEALAKQITKAGYETNSKNFTNTLYQSLYKSEEFTRKEDGRYVLA